MMIDTLDGKQVLTSKKLCFLLAIAGRLDAVSELSKPGRDKLGFFAQKANTSKIAYYPFAVLDGLNLSYSMFKYYFDAVIADNHVDLHQVMLTPGGIAAIAAESIFIITFSFLACHFDGEKTDNIKKFIVKAWPYARDVMKALKNSYKGFRSMLQLIGLLSGQNLLLLLFPAGLALSIVSAAVRFWLRDMTTKRKVMMEKNADLLTEIKTLKALVDDERWESYRKQIERQTVKLRSLAFAAVAFTAITDSWYYYIGMLTLTTLTAAVLWPLVAVCFFYAISCIASRLYEEYVFQKILIRTQVECELNLIGKRLDTVYKSLLKAKELGDESQYNDLLDKCADLSEQFDKKRQELYSFSRTSYKEAFLLGLSQGLYAHGTLSCALFIVGMALVLCSTAFPPALLITGVLIGLAFMAAFISRSLILTYSQRHKPNEPLKKEPAYQQFENFNALLQERTDGNVDLLSQDDFENALQDGLLVKSAPESKIQDWLEIVRSFFSGLGKGQKITDFTLNPLMEADDHGHYHDTPVMFGLMAASCVVFSITRAIRALAKGFGRTPPGTVKELPNDTPAEAVDITAPHDDQPPPPKFISNPEPQTGHALSRNRSWPVLGFFGKPGSVTYIPESSFTETASI